MTLATRLEVAEPEKEKERYDEGNTAYCSTNNSSNRYSFLWCRDRNECGAGLVYCMNILCESWRPDTR